MTQSFRSRKWFLCFLVIGALILFFSSALYKINHNFESKIRNQQVNLDRAVFILVILAFPGGDTDKGWVSSIPDLQAEGVIRESLQIENYGYHLKKEGTLIHIISNAESRLIITVDSKNNRPIIKKSIT